MSVDSALPSAPTGDSIAGGWLRARVQSVHQEALGIRSYELAPVNAAGFPPFAAGAHIDVKVPNGISRNYSLCNPPGESHRYLIAVKREDAGRGGSISLYDNVRGGDVLDISTPRNLFPLAADARRHVLIAGGIGITPILAMAHELRARGADFSLYFCTRSPELTPFHELLSGPDFAGRVVFHHDQGEAARALPLAPITAGRQEGTHLYCCGPRPLMDAVRGATLSWPAGTVHFEDFGGTPVEAKSGDRPFRILIKSTDKVFEVPVGRTILQVLLDNGFDVPSSCESGTCGTCMTSLLAGVADHRDFVLDEVEGRSRIMICISRAASEELTLDV